MMLFLGDRDPAMLQMLVLWSMVVLLFIITVLYLIHAVGKLERQLWFLNQKLHTVQCQAKAAKPDVSHQLLPESARKRLWLVFQSILHHRDVALMMDELETADSLTENVNVLCEVLELEEM